MKFIKNLMVCSVLFSPLNTLADDCMKYRASHEIVALFLKKHYEELYKQIDVESTLNGPVGDSGKQWYKYVPYDIICAIYPRNGMGNSDLFYFSKVDCYDGASKKGLESFDVFYEDTFFSGCELGFEKTSHFGRHITNFYSF